MPIPFHQLTSVKRSSVNAQLLASNITITTSNGSYFTEPRAHSRRANARRRSPFGTSFPPLAQGVYQEVRIFQQFFFCMLNMSKRP